MFNLIQVYGQTNIYAAASEQLLERQVYWPGGHGKVVADIVNTVGPTSRISLVQVGTYSGMSYYELAPGIFPITTDGVWDFIAPECSIWLEIRLAPGDEIFINHLNLIIC